MKRTLSSLGFLALGAAIAALGWQVGNASSAHPAAPSATALDLENEVEMLRGEVEMLKRRPLFVGSAAVAAPTAKDKAAAATSAPDVPQDDSTAGATETARMDTTVRTLDRHLDGDRWDHAWGQQVGGAVRGALAAGLPGSRLVDIRCGSAFCRLQVAHAAPREQRDFASSLRDAPELETERFYRYDRTDGALVTAVYLARPDQRLPLALEE